MGQAKFSLGTVLTNRAMNETNPGVYEGVYAPRKGDNVSGAKVVVSFTPAGFPEGQARGRGPQARRLASRQAARPRL